MRLAIVLAAVVALAFVFTAGAAEDDRSGDEEVKTVTIKLTSEQLREIGAAKTANVTINLTNEQITAISKEFKNFKGETVTLNADKHVIEGNTICVSVDRVGEANPQPSP
ncbi:MAG: hypothetical protein JSW52_09860 [Candidatus Coatesbacteria bacterium]|nr:MAG: hypothetical protein JSW52_09860 [Candidatus Coatesbacteria bacterium]